MEYPKTHLALPLLLLLLTLVPASSTERPIHESLLGSSMRGQWRISNNKRDILGVPNYNENADDGSSELREEEAIGLSLVSFFNSTKGNCEVLVTQSEGADKKPYVYIQLLNSKYVNGRVAELSFKLERGYNKSVNQWKTPKFLAAVRLFNKLEPLISFDININMQMKKNINKQLQMALISDSLNIDLFLQPVQYSLSYFISLTLINVIQIVLLVYFGGNQTVLGNTSEWLILQTCFYFAFQSLFLFKLALAYYDTRLAWLFFNFVTNVAVMMLILWKFTAVIQKFRNKLHFLKALLFSILYFQLMFSYYTSGTFWVVESNIFLWQIGYSIFRGGFGGVSIQLVLTIILSRIPLLAILKSDDNILKFNPDPLAFRFIVAILCIHLTIIGLQKRFGSRFFTPVKIIPNYFNYLRQALFQSQTCSSQCSICFNELRQKPHTPARPAEQKQKQLREKKGQLIKYVYTKCNHAFHKECLNDWLNVHLVCPNCRTGLPPMNLGTA